MFLPASDSAVHLLIFAAVIGYILGSIPFGILITRIFSLGDLREIGSGNIGATNVLRTGSKLAAFSTLVLDISKGAAAVLLGMMLGGEDCAQIAGFGALMGHMFPIWLAFKGGKAVATYLGIVSALSLVMGGIACLLWLCGALSTRTSSIGGLTATALLPVLSIWLSPEMVVLTAVMGILVWIRHLKNIERVMNGTEPKIKL